MAGWFDGRVTAAAGVACCIVTEDGSGWLVLTAAAGVACCIVSGDGSGWLVLTAAAGVACCILSAWCVLAGQAAPCLMDWVGH